MTVSRLPFVALSLLAIGMLFQSAEFPEPTEGDEEKQRLAYIETLHRTAPGVDWRAIDMKTRLMRYQSAVGGSRFPVPGQRSAVSAPRTSFIETIANGHLSGQWREKGSANNSGRIHVAVMDTLNQKIYCGSAGGNVWKGNADGTGWEVLNDKLQFDNILQIFLVPVPGGQRLVVPVGGKCCWYSDDDGLTWNQSAGFTNMQSWGGNHRAVMAADAAHTIYVLGNQWDYVNWNAVSVLYRSTDQGASFQQIDTWSEPTYGSVSRFDLWAQPEGDSAVWMLRGLEVLKLDPVTGLPVPTGGQLPNTAGTELLTGSMAGGSLSLYVSLDGDIHRSVDQGATWQPTGSTGQWAFSRNSFNASLTRPGEIYFGSVECRRSQDGGATWSMTNLWTQYYGNPAIYLHADIPAVQPFYDLGRVERTFICTDGGLYRSDDGAQTVTNLSLHGLNVSQYYTSYTDRGNTNYIYAGSQDQGFQQADNDSGVALGFDQLVSGDYGHIVSSNGGASLWFLYPGILDYMAAAVTGNISSIWSFSGFPLWMPPLVADPSNPQVVFMAGGNLSGTGSRIIRVANVTGIGLIQTEGAFDFHAAAGDNLSALEISTLNTQHRYAATANGKFFHSPDGGTTWIQSTGFTGPGQHYFYGNDIHASRLTPGVLWLAGSGYSAPGFYRSADHGQTFTAAVTGLPPTLIYAITTDDTEEFVFAATEVGPYVYVVSEDRWYPMAGTGAPDQTYWEVDFIPSTQTVRFVTYGRGMWDFAIAGVNVGTGETADRAGELRAFPNPAAGPVTLHFGTPLEQAEDLVLYSLSGAEILRRTLPAGTQNYRFDTACLPPGVCLVSVGRRHVRVVVTDD